MSMLPDLIDPTARPILPEGGVLSPNVGPSSSLKNMSVAWASIVYWRPRDIGELFLRGAREALAADYETMRTEDVMVGRAFSFSQLARACADVEAGANKPATSRS